MKRASVISATALTLGVLALSACAKPVMRAPHAIGGSGAPAPTPGLDWFDHRDGDALSLAYGRETSDDLRLRLDCEAGSGTLTLTAPAEGTDRVIHLESGGDTERFPATVEPSGMGDGELLIASSVAAPAGVATFPLAGLDRRMARRHARGLCAAGRVRRRRVALL